MSLHYIIDGYNITNHSHLCRTHKKINSLPSLLSELIKTRKLCGSLKNKVTIVFDGYPNLSHPRHYDNQINIIFSKEESADERIRGIINISENKKNIVVVSDDKEIMFFAKICGATTMTVEEFISPLYEHSGESISNSPENDSKQELTYSQINQINKELRRIWLK